MKVALDNLLRALARINQWSLWVAAWALLALIAVATLNVALRDLAGWSSVALQESALYLHALLVILGLAGTWQRNGHVRIDVFYGAWSRRRQRALDMAGVLLLLLPFCVFVVWVSADYVTQAWQRQESSAEPGGLPWLWLLKTLLLIMPVQLAIAGLVMCRGWHRESEAESQEGAT